MALAGAPIAGTSLLIRRYILAGLFRITYKPLPLKTSRDALRCQCTNKLVPHAVGVMISPPGGRLRVYISDVKAKRCHRRRYIYQVDAKDPGKSSQFLQHSWLFFYDLRLQPDHKRDGSSWLHFADSCGRHIQG